MGQMNHRPLLVVATLLQGCVLLLPSLKAQSVSFQRDVLPILSDRCFQCHGPDEKARKGRFRLDLAASALRTTDPVVVPGQSSASELIARVSSRDPDERMPPVDSKLNLTAAQVDTLKRWVDEGAHWDRHWAFVPPKRVNPPPVRDSNWASNDIDRFVLEKLEQRGFSPSPRASRETLLRRVTLDLTGLPPTLKEIDDFLADPSGDAYERVVDRLLRSPRFGERMAWEWLDAARYADTDGFQADPTRSMWPWRDWLIRALNENMPFDQFTVELLAGDMLPGAGDQQVLATGFNRNHMYNGEGGRIAEETRVENVFDRTETTSTVWLGLTFTCARCHDHKFDPITQKEYYQLFAFFNQTSESGAGGSGKAPPVMEYHAPQQVARLGELDKQIAALTLKMSAPDPGVDRAQVEWEKKTVDQIHASKGAMVPAEATQWRVLGPFAPPGGDLQKAFPTEMGPEKGVDLARKYGEGNLFWRPETGFVDGRTHALSGDLGATYLYRTLEVKSSRILEVSLGSDDALKVWLNGEEVLSKNVNRGVAPDQERVRLDLRRGVNEFLMKIVNTGGRSGFYFRKAGETVLGLPAEVAELLMMPGAKRDSAQRQRLLEYYRGQHLPSWKTAAGKRARMAGERGKLKKGAVRVMVMDSLPKSRRRGTRVLARGTYDRPLEAVTAGTPALLPAIQDGTPANRLDLARWLVSGKNPLTARVTVNRYWQVYFGTGLVETSEDFGRQGSPPSHPGLLDWLATKFVDDGWDVKSLHKRIVMSATYCQSSVDEGVSDSPASKRVAYGEDPGNRWLGRGPRFRMPSWMMRDQALALSGLLVGTIGGPPVKPYQPEGIWAEATFNKIRYKRDMGDKLYRRSLYTFWRRIVGPTMFFDGGKRQLCVVKQSRTNTPLHALTTLNATSFVEAARVMAERVMREGGTDTAARLRFAFRLATGRQAAESELNLLVSRWRNLRGTFEADLDKADKLLSEGEWTFDASLDRAGLAAYAVVCSLLMNLDEVLTKS